MIRQGKNLEGQGATRGVRSGAECRIGPVVADVSESGDDDLGKSPGGPSSKSLTRPAPDIIIAFCRGTGENAGGDAGQEQDYA